MDFEARKLQKKLFTLLDLCVSSLRRGHANLLCIVPILTDDPRRESGDVFQLKLRRLGKGKGRREEKKEEAAAKEAEMEDQKANILRGLDFFKKPPEPINKIDFYCSYGPGMAPSTRSLDDRLVSLQLPSTL